VQRAEQLLAPDAPYVENRAALRVLLDTWMRSMPR
jgi:hypothetical protein